MELEPKIKKIIHFFIATFIITLVIIIICLLMLKYAVEGEDNMPFELSQLVVVSTAEGIDKGEGESTWNFNLVQNNDIYINIAKNKNYKETEIIKKIILNNFKVEEAPKTGKLVIYRQSADENKIFEYDEKYFINDELVYNGSEYKNEKNLEIANQGGIILFRVCNNEIGEYSSDEEEVVHNGTILSKINLGYDDIKCKISFDLTIELTNGTKFTGNIPLELPVGNIVNTGISNYEKTDFKDIVFKRN